MATPNVDVATEAIHQATAAYDFAMNAQVMRVYSQMTKTLLDVQAYALPFILRRYGF